MTPADDVRKLREVVKGLPFYVIRDNDRLGLLDALAALECEQIPREPTTEMMLAGMAVQDENDGQDTAGVWRAMYDAAREGQP